MAASNGRVAAANAVVEEEIEGYSDEVEEEAEDDETAGELDITARLNQPLSYNRSLLELYGISLSPRVLT